MARWVKYLSRPDLAASRAYRLWSHFRYRWAYAREYLKNELGQSIVRLIIGAGIGAFIALMAVSAGGFYDDLWPPTIVFAITLFFAFVILAHLVADPRPSKLRRVTANVLDIGSLSLFMYLGDNVTAPFFPVYIWVILANGFRYGERALLRVAILSLVCFSLVTIATPFWRDNIPLALGLLIAIAALPAYVYRLLRRLNEARTAAESANRAKSQFLASVSHEIRTPLNAIIGLSEILRGSRLQGEQREMIRSIGVSAETLLELMTDLLNLSKIEAGGLTREAESFRFFKLLADIEAIATAQARLNGLSFSMRLLTPMPAIIHAHSQHIKEVLVNLTANAIKYTDNGSVCLSIELMPPTAGKHDPASLAFHVMDTGIGIRAEDQDRIFESFTQSSEGNGQGRGGVGLGLAICKRLVESMDGDISVSSKPGNGSVFTVELPVRIEEETASRSDLHLEESQLQLIGRLPALRQNITELFGENAIGTECGALDQLIEVSARQPGNTRARTIILIDEGSITGQESLEKLDYLKRMSVRAPIIMLAHDPDSMPDPADIPAPVDACLPRDAGARSAAFLNAMTFASLRALSAASDGSDDTGETGVSLNILVAEDNHTNRIVAGKMLRTLGHKVFFANDGEAALEAMSSRDFDIIFMDVNMPGTDGLDATRIRRYEEMGGQHTPIIGLTADATEEGRRQCMDAGMDRVMHKPVSLAALKFVINGVIRKDERLLEKARSGEHTPETSTVRTHPRFENSLPAILDHVKLGELADIDEGGDFLASVIGEFLDDAASLLDEMEAALMAGSTEAFRDNAHALQSCAANIGAQRILNSALHGKEITRANLAEKGSNLIKALSKDLEVTRIELRNFLKGADDTGDADDAAGTARPA